MKLKILHPMLMYVQLFQIRNRTMSKQEALFLGSLVVSGFIIGWLVSAICGLPYFLMSFMYPVVPILGLLLFVWWMWMGESTLTYGLMLIIGLGVGGITANFANPAPQEVCERN